MTKILKYFEKLRNFTKKIAEIYKEHKIILKGINVNIENEIQKKITKIIKYFKTEILEIKLIKF